MLQPYLLTPHLLSRKGRPPLSGEVISAEGTESARGPTPAPSVPEKVPAPPPAQPIPTLVVNDPTDDAPSLVFTDEQELPGSTYTWSNSSHIGSH